MKDFVQEIRARAAEGYSVRQLMKSHIPDVGGEVKIPAAEVTAALTQREVKILNAAKPINFLLARCHYCPSPTLKGGSLMEPFFDLIYMKTVVKKYSFRWIGSGRSWLSLAILGPILGWGC